MAEFQVPGSVQFLEIVIESSNGKKLDITDLVGELNIYESITTPLLTADIVILDATGLLANLPIAGQEKLTGKIKQIDTIDTFEFFVTTIEDVSNINQFTIKYTLNLVEPAFINNLVSLVSESYTGPISEIITQISEDFLEIDIDAEPTDGNFKVVIPNWNPYRAVKWLSRKAMSSNGVPCILYNTWRNGVKLRSFETLFNQTPIERYKYQQQRSDLRTASRGKTDQNKEMVQTPFIFYPTQQNPLIEVMAKGGYSSRYRMVDTFSKSYEENNFNIDEYFDGAPSLAKFNPVNKNFLVKNKTLGESFSTFEQTRFHSSESFGQSHLNYSGNTLDVSPFRNSYMSRLTNYSYKLGVHGREDLEVGAIVELEISKNMITQKQKTDEVVDDRRTGKHIVTNVRHQYTTGGTYKIIADVARESIEQDL